MNYLNPEIEALYKKMDATSLVRPTISCGIFQDCDYSEERPKLYYQQKLENTED